MLPAGKLQRDKRRQHLRNVLHSGYDKHIRPGFHPEHGFSGMPLFDGDDMRLSRALQDDPELRELTLRAYAERSRQAEELFARGPSHQEQLERCPLQRARLPAACNLVSLSDCTKFLCLYHALPDGTMLEGEDRRLHLEAAHTISAGLRAANITAQEHARDPERYAPLVHVDMSHHIQRRAYVALVDKSYSILGYDLVVQAGYDLCASPIYFKFVVGFFEKVMEASLEVRVPGLSVE